MAPPAGTVPPGSRAIEWKTQASAIATFLVASAGLAWIGTESSDFVHGLPDWLEVPAYGAIAALASLLAGYVARHKPEALSSSAIAALRYRVRGDH